MNFAEILDIDPYGLPRDKKHVLINSRLKELTEFHYKSCPEYRKMFDISGIDIKNLPDYKLLPPIPVSLFKEFDLKSIPQQEVIKTMTSSGTTGQNVSKIYIDKNTSANQTKVLVKIVSSFIGTKRVPMIILDTSSIIKDRNMFSARGAGILGFSMFASKKIYALDENMELDVDILNQFLNEHKEETILLFGFTFIIWQHFYKKLLEKEFKPDLSKAILIHGGGWKNLANEQVSPADFKQQLHESCGINISNIHDYYGMVEQTGTISMECEYGHLHSSVFSDVIVRNPLNFKIAKNGERGIIEVVSLVPESYPGHILLTEDEGIILGEDDCLCGRKGKYFKVLGRVKNAEIRGCSDTYSVRQSPIDELQYVIGDGMVIEKMSIQKPMVPFSDVVVSFLNDLSKKLLRTGREYSDVVTFGFWCRRSAMIKEKVKYDDLNNRLGKGIVFHSTPSNVPVNFAFSFASGLLAGNANIVRLPAKEFPQVNIICQAINELLSGDYSRMAPYISMIKYSPNKEITDKFSAICDTRIIWGGDATIAELRKSPLRARSNEVTFADRHSIAVINSDRYMECSNKAKVAQDFYNDTYFSDQNACTAPRIVVWMGESIKEAKKEFWNQILYLSNKNYSITAVQTVGKISALYKAGVHFKVDDVIIEMPNIVRIKVDKLSANLMEYKYNSGYFYEYDSNNLTEILPVCDKKCQTLTYYGLSVEELLKFFSEDRPHGVDRAVPMGKSMDFTLVWDGYDLIRTLSRKINII